MAFVAESGNWVNGKSCVPFIVAENGSVYKLQLLMVDQETQSPTKLSGQIAVNICS